ncbi:hypothetical protein [Rhodopseudomonas palustris]|uniref:hypothetical protein n=1 Tax=Rhodopseudomonas palustris TaxID=1076 RepID=UPI0014031201|nr:hypothetical protein [Rhodopseudomonas palustris]
MVIVSLLALRTMLAQSSSSIIDLHQSGRETQTVRRNTAARIETEQSMLAFEIGYQP